MSFGGLEAAQADVLGRELVELSLQAVRAGALWDRKAGFGTVLQAGEDRVQLAAE